MNSNPGRLILIAAIFLAAGVLAWWIIFDPVSSFRASVPGMDHRRKGPVARKPVAIGSEFRFFSSKLPR